MWEMNLSEKNWQNTKQTTHHTHKDLIIHMHSILCLHYINSNCTQVPEQEQYRYWNMNNIGTITGTVIGTGTGKVQVPEQ